MVNHRVIGLCWNRILACMHKFLLPSSALDAFRQPTHLSKALYQGLGFWVCAVGLAFFTFRALLRHRCVESGDFFSLRMMDPKPNPGTTKSEFLFHRGPL